MQTGTWLTERYRIEEKLGEGGMGVVYKAHDTLLDRPVAIKSLASHLLSDQSLKRFLREAQSAAKLTHPHIVAIYDVLEEGDTRLIVMEFVAGQTLRARLPLPWADAVEIGAQVCMALAYAHAHGVVHRDIKPENIIITANGVAKVMDFGLARSEGRSRMTQTGLIVGTVAYMAPEQALSGRTDGRSDLYSLGAVLYETVTGKAPFEAEDPIAVISMHVNVPPVSPRFYRPEIPPALEAMILRLLAKDPMSRYGSADELAQVFKTALMPRESANGRTSAVEATLPATSLFEMMTRGRLVNREEELGALKSALESMLSGKGQVALVAGEPGIGKTRLAEELLVYARLRSCLAMVGRCYEQEVNVPYLPFSEALRGALQGISDDQLAALAGPYAPELVKFTPELAQRIPGLAPSPPLEPDQERLRLYDSVAGFLTRLARGQPVVLMLDDLHWADAATLHLFWFLARKVRTERLLLVGTYRDVEIDLDHPLSAVLSEMNRERLYIRVLTRRLSPEHVRAMIQSILQMPERVSDEFRDLIYRETEGNPFFVEEILKHLVEVGALHLEDGQWQRKPIEEIDVPQSMREVIGRRLKRVADSCQRVLGLAAVIGRRFRFEVLQAIGELQEAELLDALEEAMEAQLIREERAAGGVEYDFVHALIREVLYERLSLRRRMTFHKRVGETLERLYEGRIEAVVEDLAHHFTRAPHGEGLEKAIRYSLEAAGKAMRLFAHEEAVRYYQNAAELLVELGDETRLAEVHLALAEPFVFLGNMDSAVAAYERAFRYYDRHGPVSQAARVQRLIGRALQRHREWKDACPYLERALKHLSEEEQVTDVIQTRLDLARAQTFMGMLPEAEQHATRALALAERAGAVTMEAEGHAALGFIAQSGADLDKAILHYGEAIKLTRDVDDPDASFTLWRSKGNLALTHQARGEFEVALSLHRESVEAARRVRNMELIRHGSLLLHNYYRIQGEWELAKGCLLDVLRLPLPPTRLRWAEYWLRFSEGELEGAIPIARELVEDNRRTGEAGGFFNWSAQLARLNLELGRIEDARVASAEAGEVRVAFWLLTPPFAFVLEALARGGDHQRCAALCTRGEAVSRAANSPAGLTVALYGSAVLALEQGDPDQSIELLEESLRASKQMSVELHVRILQTLGHILIHRGNQADRKRAHETLQECLMLLERMGDARKAEQVRTELSRLA